MGKNLTEIAMAFIGVAVITLLVGRSKDTVRIIRAGTSGFQGLLQTVTLQGGYGNAFDDWR